MKQGSIARAAFEVEVKGRFGILPNFFSSAQAAPELIQELWGFAKAGYLDNPMPALFKERLFVWLSRFCPARYCIVRHVGFLLGHGRPAGDADAPTMGVAEVIGMLKRPTPWARDMSSAFARLEALPSLVAAWPEAGTEMEDLIFACAAIVFVEPARSEQARQLSCVLSGHVNSSSSAASWPSFARRITGRCCTRRSRPKRTCAS